MNRRTCSISSRKKCQPRNQPVPNLPTLEFHFVAAIFRNMSVWCSSTTHGLLSKHFETWSSRATGLGLKTVLPHLIFVFEILLFPPCYAWIPYERVTIGMLRVVTLRNSSYFYPVTIWIHFLSATHVYNPAPLILNHTEEALCLNLSCYGYPSCISRWAVTRFI